MSVASIPIPQRIFITVRDAADFLECDPLDIDDYIKAGKVRQSGHRWPRRVFTEDILAIQRETQKEAAPSAPPPTPPNYTLGTHPGCGACLHICPVCRRITQRSNMSNLITEKEAMYILGCARSELISYVRRKMIGIYKPNTKWRYYFQDVQKIVQRQALGNFKVADVRRGIVGAIGYMIDLRWQEMMELDVELAQYSVGHEQPQLRYGSVVDLTEPPAGLWYVYHLCHPSGRPFYVGKGTGNRMYMHEKEAVKGNGHNSYKCGVIRKILKKGLQVLYRVVFVTPEETEAYEYEIQEIARLGGYKKLTNLTLGGATKEEYGRAFGSHVPREQKNYKQYLDLLRLYPELTDDKRKRALRFWADERIYALRRLREDAESLSYDEAVQRIDAEIDAIQPLTARQRAFADILDRRRRYADEWDE